MSPGLWHRRGSVQGSRGEHEQVGASTRVSERACDSERVGDTVPCPVTEPFLSASPPKRVEGEQKESGGRGTGGDAAQPSPGTLAKSVCLGAIPRNFSFASARLFWERAGLCTGRPRKISGNPQRRGAATDSPGGFFFPKRGLRTQPSFARKGFDFCHPHGGCHRDEDPATGWGQLLRAAGAPHASPRTFCPFCSFFFGAGR